MKSTRQYLGSLFIESTIFYGGARAICNGNIVSPQLKYGRINASWIPY